MPAPVLASERLVPVIAPAKVSGVVLATVKVAGVPLSVTVPVPVTLPTCCPKPARSKVPLSTKEVPPGKAVATPPARTALALMVVVPV